MAFLDRSPKEFASGAALMLSVEVDPLRKTIKHLPHEEHWDLAEGDRTDASITSLTYRYPQGPAGAA